MLLIELRDRGSAGGYTMLKLFTASLVPKELAAPTVRFETEPGEQMQVEAGKSARERIVTGLPMRRTWDCRADRRSAMRSRA